MAERNSQLLNTALALIDGYKRLDIDAMMAPRAATCTHSVLPARLNLHAQDNEAYREYFSKNIIPYFQNFQVEILDTVEDQTNHKVVFHIKDAAETPVGPYENEYLLVLHMTEDDQEVLKVKEFLDSGYCDGFFPKLDSYISQQRK